MWAKGPRPHRAAGLAFKRTLSPQLGLLLAPYLIFLVLFGVLPTAYALVLSFLDNASGAFVGLGNYLEVLRDFRFLPALVNVALFLALWLPAMLFVVCALALLLHARPGPFADLLRTLYYLPGAVTGAAGALLWIFMFTPELSPFKLLYSLLGQRNLSDVLSSGLLPLAVAIMVLFSSAGYWVVVLYGALQGLPRDTLEAALIDGAGEAQLAWRIKLPLIARYLVLMLILNVAGGLQVFVEPQLLNVASQGSFGSPTWSLNQLAYYNAASAGRFSSSAALSVLLLLVSLGLALTVLYRTDFYRTDVLED